jgi:TM2 domain-containing membrane protein YozV
VRVVINGGIEKALWSVAIPGFGQFLNKKYFKGIVLIILEFLINVKANINTAIVLSFLGQTELAVETSNYQWLMFYPCVYLFSIWDAFRDGSKDEEKPLLFLPFAIAAYVETAGVIYSKVFRINGVLLGPIFLPMACIFIGLGIGFIIRYIILRIKNN